MDSMADPARHYARERQSHLQLGAKGIPDSSKSIVQVTQTQVEHCAQCATFNMNDNGTQQRARLSPHYLKQMKQHWATVRDNEVSLPFRQQFLVFARAQHERRRLGKAARHDRAWELKTAHWTRWCCLFAIDFAKTEYHYCRELSSLKRQTHQLNKGYLKAQAARRIEFIKAIAASILEEVKHGDQGQGERLYEDLVHAIKHRRDFLPLRYGFIAHRGSNIERALLCGNHKTEIRSQKISMSGGSKIKSQYTVVYGDD